MAKMAQIILKPCHQDGKKGTNYINTSANLATNMARKAQIILIHLPSLPPRWQGMYKLY
jgi:hypothetical protein